MNEKLHVGQGQYAGGGVTVFPVWLESAPLEGYCWKTKHIRVNERDGGTVNALTVTNTGVRPHIVIEGDMFIGGRQNRTLVMSTIINRGETRDVAVACVEEGRWHGGSQHGHSSRRVPYSVAREMSQSKLHLNLDLANESMAGQSVQSEVWNKIREHESRKGSVPAHSLIDSMAMFEEQFANDARPTREEGVTEPRLLEGQRGVLIGIGGQIVGGELFGSSEGLKSRFDAIMASVRYEAMDAPLERTPALAARSFAEALEHIEFDTKAKEAKTKVDRVGSLNVSSFGVDDHLIHASIFDANHPVFA